METAGENSVPRFLGKTHYLVPYFLKIHFSDYVSQYFFPKNIATVQIIPVGKWKRKDFSGPGRKPHRYQATAQISKWAQAAYFHNFRQKCSMTTKKLTIFSLYLFA